MVLGPFILTAALSADNAPGKYGARGVRPVPILLGYFPQTLLHRLKGAGVNDRRMRPLSVVSGKLAVVGALGLFDVVVPEGFLQERVSGKLLIGQKHMNVLGLPGPAQNAAAEAFIQIFREGAHRRPVNESAEHLSHRRGFRLVNADLAVLNAISEHESPVHQLSVFKGFLNAPFLVVACGPALFLGKGRQDRKHQFARRAEGVDILLLEEYVDAEFLQLPHRFKQCDRVARQPGNALRNDQIEFSRSAVRHHAAEVFTVFLRPCNTLVGVYSAVQPAGMLLDHVAVVADLRGERMQHRVLSCGDPGIRRDPGDRGRELRPEIHPSD